jgi:ParB-like chromosome segregation protein Spo0J
MTLRRLPLDALEPHPENANRMPDRLLAKLRRHIERTGLYEPLVVRPLHADRGRQAFQIVNGHHRARVLRELGHTRARCDVWDVGDEEARLLLATLNRLEGRDNPSARAALVARLAAERSAEELAALLPEPPDAVARLLALSKPPPEPVPPEALAPPLRPMTFFLTEEQHDLASEALREIGPRVGRAERLERLARWYLESIDRL